jgi:acetyl esterase/lipase
MGTEVTVEKDIVYGRGGDVDLLLDIYRPAADTDKHVAVIQVYGGGFRNGSKDRHVNERAQELAERGYTGVTCTYRLSGVAKWPSQVHDVKAAIRWTRANAEYLGVDPDKICIAGYSAGGQLAMICAGSPDDAKLEGNGGNPGVSSAVAACIGFYASYMKHPDLDGGGSEVMPAGSTAAEYEATNPLAHIHPGYPPTILLYGTDDTGFPPSIAMGLFNKLQAAGVASELHLIAGLPHIFDRYQEFTGPCNEFIDLFLDRYIVNPRDYPAFVVNRPVVATA